MNIEFYPMKIQKYYHLSVSSLCGLECPGLHAASPGLQRSQLVLAASVMESHTSSPRSAALYARLWRLRCPASVCGMSGTAA